MKHINSERNLSMLMDFYELTMSNGYFKNGLEHQEVIFDMFYRKNPDHGGFVIAAGLEQFIEYINNLHFSDENIAYLKTKEIFDDQFLAYLKDFKFQGDIYAVPEGTIVYPNTPIVTVKAKIIEAQLIETMLLLTINHQSLIATKANRMVRAAQGKPIFELGARRAHGYDAALYGARAAYIGGVSASATTSAEQLLQVPSIGTMAHSWVQLFSNEYDAFVAYANAYPDGCNLLIDTVDVLKSGIKNAIKVAKEILEPNGYRLKGIRLDSGDLAYLSKECRNILDQHMMQDCKIIVSNSIDEYLITSLLHQGACIDSFGVGERLITSKSEPVFGGVYKLVAVKEDALWIPRIKISENIEKVTNPGYKKLWRLYHKDNHKSFADVLTLEDEIINESESYYFVDPSKPWYKILTNDFIAKELHVPIFIQGKQVYESPSIESIRSFVSKQLAQDIWVEELRFENPHIHYVNLSQKLWDLKVDMLKVKDHE